MLFAKRVFFFAGVYGLIALAPMYFMEAKLGRDLPPPITHPEHFYGFIGVALAWQILFIVLSKDPIRYGAMMVPAILEKLAFGVAVVVLFAQGRVTGMTLGPASVDLVLAVLFTVAYMRTPKDAGAVEGDAQA